MTICFLGFQYVTGSSQVVVGDLVYCRQDKAPDVVGADNCEYDDDTSGDVGDMLNEATEVDLPVEGNSPVKVNDSPSRKASLDHVYS